MQFVLNLLEGTWSPHPGQREFLAAASPRHVLACGRRWGKTDAAAVWLLAGLVQPGRPQKLLTVAPTLDQARLVFDRVETLLDRLLESGRVEGKLVVKRTPYPQLTFNGHELAARSCHHIHRLRGREATRIVVDEAAFVPSNLVPEILTPMLATTDGELALISSPNGQNHFWREFERGQRGEGGTWSRRAPSAENPLVSASFLAAQRLLMPEAAYRVEFEAEFLDCAGAVFPSDIVEPCVQGDLAWGRGQVVLGVDWARYRDYTAIVVGQSVGGCLEIVHEERLFREPWAVQVAKVADLARRTDARLVGCDSTGVGDAVTEQLREALPEVMVRPVVFTAASKLALINDLRVAFERQTLKLLPSQDLLRELQHFSWRQGRMEGTDGFHDDLVMALALTLHVAPKASGLQVLVGDVRRFSRRIRQHFSRAS